MHAIIHLIKFQASNTKNLKMFKDLKLYQIFYDESSKGMISDGFIGLDNSAGPSWLYEAFPIYQFIQNSVSLNSDSWLGFFSPKFHSKTNLTSDDIVNTFYKNRDFCDPFLFSSYWHQAAGNQNVWLQGENNHPGLLYISQLLAHKSNYKINIKSSITSLQTAVFSNYFIANMKFWQEWYRVVSIYFELIKNNQKLLGKNCYLSRQKHPNTHFCD